MHERRDAHQRHRGVGRVGAQALALPDRSVGAVGHQRDAQAVGVLARRIEEGLGVLGPEPGGEDADVDLTGVHGGEQLVERGGGGQVAAEEVGDALVAPLGQEGLGRLAAQGVDPEVDDGHAWLAWVASPASAALALALALALRR